MEVSRWVNLQTVAGPRRSRRRGRSWPAGSARPTAGSRCGCCSWPAGWPPPSGWRWRGGPGAVESAVTVVFLISFPVAFSGASAGLTVLDAIWRAVGSIALIVFLYLFPRGQFEPRWTAVAVSCPPRTSPLAPSTPRWRRPGRPGGLPADRDLPARPAGDAIPVGVEPDRPAPAADRRGDQRGIGRIGQLILFGALSAGWLGPASSAESVVEPISYALALLMPAGVTLAMVPAGAKASRGGRSADPVRRRPRRPDRPTRARWRRDPRSGRELLSLRGRGDPHSLRLPAVSIELTRLQMPAVSDAPESRTVVVAADLPGRRDRTPAVTSRGAGPASRR